MKTVVFPRIALLFIILNGCLSSGSLSIRGKKCSTVSVNIENKQIENLFFDNLLKRSLTEKIKSAVRMDGGNAENCVLSVSIQKSYRDSIIDDDGSVLGRNARYRVSYTLSKEEIMVKKGNFSMFYNMNISKYQYSSAVLYEKEEKNNMEKISKKIFLGIRKFLE